jgi:hypothetical protein
MRIENGQTELEKVSAAASKDLGVVRAFLAHQKPKQSYLGRFKTQAEV